MTNKWILIIQVIYDETLLFTIIYIRIWSNQSLKYITEHIQSEDWQTKHKVKMYNDMK